MGMFTAVRNYVATRRAAYAVRRTEMQVNALPPEIQKDIGWPGFMPERGHRDETAAFARRH